MRPDEERWAEALQIEKMHGADARAWVEHRLASLRAAGDEAGVRRFCQISACLAKLTPGGVSC